MFFRLHHLFKDGFYLLVIFQRNASRGRSYAFEKLPVRPTGQGIQLLRSRSRSNEDSSLGGRRKEDARGTGIYYGGGKEGG